MKEKIKEMIDRIDNERGLKAIYSVAEEVLALQEENEHKVD